VAYLRVLHDEHIAEDGVQPAAVFSCTANGSLRNDDVVLLDHARDVYGRSPDERVILDLFVEIDLSLYVKCARYQPLNVVGQARQNLRMVGTREGVHIFLNGLLIRAHGPLMYVKIGSAEELARAVTFAVIQVG
jgi:hypothetical protein